MKAIMVMFDSMNRKLLPGYGCEQVHAPNFKRLLDRTVTFDNCYGGSMPCIPARRELHTGRYNFLHRSWGPLEPFDDSAPEMLKRAGVYTHLVTDHKHYWGDGGATYHGRYSSFEFFRGQEGDPWKGHVADPEMPDVAAPRSDQLWRQDWVNRSYLATEADHPQTKTFDAGIEFIRTNFEQDRWFLQIESYDPHEPFFAYDQYRQLYDSAHQSPVGDWPAYRKVTELPDEVEYMRRQYLSLVSMCDRSLGRVLDVMDRLDMWDDTMLIVCTDHGLLLGEHGWWGKGVQPWYEENIHTPLFIWDPRSRVRGERRSALAQTIDFAPTLLDFFGIDPTDDMQGSPLNSVIVADRRIREGALFGSSGGHVNVTDGRYVYMRACSDASNSPLFEYTVMPMHLGGPFSVERLAEARLVEPFDFTKGVKVLQVPAEPFGNPYYFGTLLFDLHADPDQRTPLVDDDVELAMARLLVRLMRASSAPREQYERLGLPADGPVTAEHLLCRAQGEMALAALREPPSAGSFADGAVVANRTIDELVGMRSIWPAVVERFPLLGTPQAQAVLGGRTLVDAGAVLPMLTEAALSELEALISGAPSLSPTRAEHAESPH